MVYEREKFTEIFLTRNDLPQLIKTDPIYNINFFITKSKLFNDVISLTLGVKNILNQDQFNVSGVVNDKNPIPYRKREVIFRLIFNLSSF